MTRTSSSTESWWSRHQVRLAPYVFVSPFFLLYGLFFVVPILVGLYLSGTEWAGLGAPQWVGLRNYQDLLADRSFWTAVGNTGIYVVFTMCVVVPVALLIAQALNARGLRGRDMFRLAYFMPVVISPIVITLVFGLFFEREFGIVNGVLRATFGFGGIDWLGDPLWAKVSVALLVIWRWTGYLTIFFLAGLQNVPRELYEAAAIDGAGPVRRFVDVTLPSLRPVTAFIGVTVLVNSAQIFEEPFLLTQGGPGESTLSVAMFIYRAGFQRQQLGYAAAAGVLLFAVVLVLGLLANRAFGVGRDHR
ncbi:carbohydrate ABC transporter permease [Actinoalloteichus hymeniacidonis]|uniref:Permease component of ABC-type sugar transporter n=1 Tax=Actinoalloteichus hymeniacidonis TaxID=340345 RepID=A0AAC9N076_9PSEU|nr:sugar ABC transporter permease [Actinoalloteichus hymeniacidonis]AOS64666.1 permease component of ABC-type sugar transporter [Actinoalloteichus hymeniacidonis]MBB5907259.1 ABC-type sugar transport system permease subunit [Actinoalloteichus hymeniacidonis]